LTPGNLKLKTILFPYAGYAYDRTCKIY
jgi:hypothetical protein